MSVQMIKYEENLPDTGYNPEFNQNCVEFLLCI